jgi:hypothetical protein
MRTPPCMATLLVLALPSSWHACNRLGKMTVGLAKHVQKPGAQISAKLTEGQGVFGRHEDGSTS